MSENEQQKKIPFACKIGLHNYVNETILFGKPASIGVVESRCTYCGKLGMARLMR